MPDHNHPAPSERAGATPAPANPEPPTEAANPAPKAEDPAVNGAGPAPRQFGDYEILEEVARGGMGVVYRALLSWR